ESAVITLGRRKVRPPGLPFVQGAGRSLAVPGRSISGRQHQRQCEGDQTGRHRGPRRSVLIHTTAFLFTIAIGSSGASLRVDRALLDRLTHYSIGWAEHTSSHLGSPAQP